ncbi:MAG: hypothetical protein SCM11_10045 [Bacillota bacterium]|nr:hypothetical protein [Bacillota bacterium]
MKSLLALPGVFLPFNETIAILSYKHLRTLDCQIDVLAMKTPDDASLRANLAQDPCAAKFKVTYAGDYRYALFTKKNMNVLRLLWQIRRYIRQAVHMAGQKNYAVIYSSSLPNFSHLAGYRVKKKNPDAVWVASISDAIKDTPFQKYYRQAYRGVSGRIGYAITRFLNENTRCQAVAFKLADHLVFVSEEQRDFMTGRRPELLAKSLVVPFTYIDEWPVYRSLIDAGEKNQEGKKDGEDRQKDPLRRRIVHLGNVYGLRRIDCLVEGIKLAWQQDPDLHRKLQIDHYGIMEQKQRELIRAAGVGDILTAYDRIPYDETLDIMNKADVLLMLDVFVEPGEAQPYMPSKFVEYFLTDKLILSIANEGSPITRHLRQTAHISVTPDPQQIALALQAVLSRDCTVKNDYQLYENRRVIAGTLKKVLGC